MIEELKKLIAENKELADKLKDCSDDFLLKNQSLILAALDDEDIAEGHKIRLEVVGDVITWDYVPTDPEIINNNRIQEVEDMYTYKLPKDWCKYYPLTFENINWENKGKELESKVKSIYELISKGSSVKGFWLKGPSKSGKTFVMICLLNELAKIGKKVAFVNMYQFVSILEVKNGYINELSEEVSQIQDADVVIIDDLSTNKESPYFINGILIPILDYRSKANKTTIFTSNYNIDAYTKVMSNKFKNSPGWDENSFKFNSLIADLSNDEEIRIK